ncbi:unnamed protein product [Effrenium voratum]|nr:unnamed protein product [Effrenium voratum]
MDAWFQCFTRSEKVEEKADVWLTEQLKFTRDQLDKKTQQCEQLVKENKELGAEKARLSELQARHQEELEALQQDVDRLNRGLSKERGLRLEAERLLEAQGEKRDEKVQLLQEELRNLSDGLEAKEEEMLDIQFSMVELQNRCLDQGALVEENADAFQKASEELAEKEEALEMSIQKQQEMMSQMNIASAKLQGQVRQLTGELELSKAAQGEAQAARVRLEEEKEALRAELQQVRSQAAVDLQHAQERMRRQEVEAEEQRTLVQRDLQALMRQAAEEPAQEPAPGLALSRLGSAESAGLEGPGAFPAPGEVPRMVPSVLIAVEVDLGNAESCATLSISPWQTSSDYRAVVQDFLRSHRLNPAFEQAVVQYLQDLERHATTLPLTTKASMADIYSRYGSNCS